MTILHEHSAVTIEDHASRGPEGEDPLVVVVGHFGVLRVLDDLQHPEAHRKHCKQRDRRVPHNHEPRGEAPPVFNWPIFTHHVLWFVLVPLPTDSSPLCSPALERTGQPLDRLKRGDPNHRIAHGLTRHGGEGRREPPQVE